MSQEQEFTSTGVKLLHHPTVVSNLQRLKLGTPISLQIAPTSRCNLSCAFCSNANREVHEDLPIEKLVTLLRALKKSGLKTVEWTGGGEPLLYKHLELAVFFTHELGLKQGLITNGTLLSKMSKEILIKFHWIRVSMNCLDYIPEIDLPKDIRGTLGFSYVMNEKTDADVLSRLDSYVKQHNPAYVRIVPNCQATNEEQEANNKRYSAMVAGWGTPYFYQAKHFSKPPRCYWGYMKPFLLHNEWVYPCSSVVLNDDSDKTFHSKYQWVKMEDLPDKYMVDIRGGDWGCTHCVFRPQNDIIEGLLHPTGMEDFI